MTRGALFGWLVLAAAFACYLLWLSWVCEEWPVLKAEVRRCLISSGKWIHGRGDLELIHAGRGRIRGGQAPETATNDAGEAEKFGLWGRWA